MSTLSNVANRRGGMNPPSANTESCTLPKAENRGQGVSVEYAYDPKKDWHVLRASHNRERMAYEIINAKGIKAYLPSVRKVRVVGNQRRLKIVSLLPNLIFVYDTPENIRSLIDDKSKLPFLSYYYNHFRQNKYGKNPPLTINYKDMMSFIRIMNTNNKHVRYITQNMASLNIGSKVRIMEGDFTGVEGNVVRVFGQKRVLVSLNGLFSVVTAYIPSAFLEEIVDNEEQPL